MFLALYISSYEILCSAVNPILSDKLFSFIDPSRGSKLIKSTNLPLPILKFNYSLKNGEKKQKVINIDEMICESKGSYYNFPKSIIFIKFYS